MDMPLRKNGETIDYGYFGSDTEKGVINFQSQYYARNNPTSEAIRYLANGKVDITTWKALGLPVDKKGQPDRNSYAYKELLKVAKDHKTINYDDLNKILAGSSRSGVNSKSTGAKQLGVGDFRKVDKAIKPAEWNDVLMYDIKGTDAYKWFVEQTQERGLPWAFGFYRDENGIYHARQKQSLQSFKYAGYNDLYDDVFDLATDMNKAKFQFSSGDKDYILWAWKGDYLNLGAGAELGIYTNMEVNGTQTEHWLIDKSLAVPMTLKLDYNGKEIISYDPKRDDPKGQDTNKWWVTGFNPNYQDKKASELTATYTVDFSGNKDMYKDFIESDDYLKNRNKWSISKDNKYKLKFTFE